MKASFIPSTLGDFTFHPFADSDWTPIRSSLVLRE
jgi:hypothetical protein